MYRKPASRLGFLRHDMLQLVHGAEATCAGARCSAVCVNSVWSSRCVAECVGEWCNVCIKMKQNPRNDQYLFMSRDMMDKSKWRKRICLYFHLHSAVLCYQPEENLRTVLSWHLALRQALLCSLCPGSNLAGSVSLWLHTKGLMDACALEWRSFELSTGSLILTHSTLYWMSHTHEHIDTSDDIYGEWPLIKVNELMIEYWRGCVWFMSSGFSPTPFWRILELQEDAAAIRFLYFHGWAHYCTQI